MCLASSSGESSVCKQISSIELFREVDEDYSGAHLVFTTMAGPKCHSNVGRVIDGGSQLINLGSPMCTHIGIVLHETLHALGLHSKSYLN